MAQWQHSDAVAMMIMCLRIKSATLLEYIALMNSQQEHTINKYKQTQRQCLAGVIMKWYFTIKLLKYLNDNSGFLITIQQQNPCEIIWAY